MMVILDKEFCLCDTPVQYTWPKFSVFHFLYLSCSNSKLGCLFVDICFFSQTNIKIIFLCTICQLQHVSICFDYHQEVTEHHSNAYKITDGLFDVQRSMHRKYVPFDIFPMRCHFTQFMYFWKTAPHFSGGIFTHHQEHI